MIVVFFFNDTATTEIYTLSLHDALPISRRRYRTASGWAAQGLSRPCRNRTTPSSLARSCRWHARKRAVRSEEHTSELQSQSNIVCRLLPEKNNAIATHVRLQKDEVERIA